jgi:acetoin utilization deacetylase AcuC-like enzyme
MRGYGTATVPPILFRHASSLEHDTGMHPERAERIVAIERELAEQGWLGWEVRESPAVAEATLEAVHPASYVAAVRERCAEGGMLDPDTVCSAGSFRAALHAVGGAVAMVDSLMGGEARVAASIHRPPGHHAERERAMGFCLFNSIAVAARHALDVHGLERVLVLDWDVHHGNGTNDVFHADPAVLFVSIHQRPLYPGSGPLSDVGSGAGVGYTVNLPVPAGAGDETWCSLVEHVAGPLARDYGPQLVLVSAGFDAHRLDPLGGCQCTEAGFAAMAASVRRVADALDVPLGIVLEGGYELSALARSLRATLEAAAAGAPPSAPSFAIDPLSLSARAQLAAHWPVLGV